MGNRGSGSSEIRNSGSRGCAPRLTSTGFDPVATLRGLEVWSADDALKNTAALFDCSDRADVVVVTCQQNPTESQLVAGDPERHAQNRGRVTPSTKLRNNDV